MVALKQQQAIFTVMISWLLICGFFQAEMLQQRTELEVLLRQSLDDVKSEILRCLGGKSASD